MSNENPFIGTNQYNTMEYCQQVLSVVSQAIEAETALDDVGHDEVMGHHLIIQAVRSALKYESRIRKANSLMEVSS